jgi:fructokinase
MRHDVVCLGEALVDFLPSRRGQRVRDVERWHPCLGGAPANVTVGVARLGGKSALVGVTGADEFGSFIKGGLAREGVDVSGLRQTDEGKTGLGFVSLTNDGERSFTFYRTRAAETFLDTRDTHGSKRLLKAATIVHAGTNSLVQPAARAAVREVLEARHAAGQLVSCDPNLRLHLWPKPALLRGLLNQLLRLCSVVKLSDEEVQFVTGTRSVDAALEQLEARGVLLPIVTLGAEGAAFRFKGETRRVPSPAVKVIDTTGAGDGFTAGLLCRLAEAFRSQAQLQNASIAQLEPLVAFGCVVGSHVVRKLGAVAGLPRLRANGRTRRSLRHRAGPA